MARPAYKSQKGYWGRTVSQGSVSHPQPLPKWSPKKDPIQAFKRVSSGPTIAEE